MTNKERGFSAVILVVLVLIIFGIGLFLFKNKSSTEEVMMVEDDSMMMMEEEESGDFGAMEGYEEMDEPEGTPEEIDNDALEELDSLMMEIDSTTTGEELSDL